MEDPDVITRAQLPHFASGRIAAQENAQKGTTMEEVGTLGFICMVAVMSNRTYRTRGARYYTEISGPSPTWKNMQKTCSIVIIGIVPFGYYVPTGYIIPISYMYS